MLAGSIIKDFNIFKAGSLHFSMGSVTQIMVSLVLETVKPAFGRRVIPTISFATHPTSHSKRFELVLKGIAGVLTATIRMMHDARFRSAAKPGHRQCVRHDICRRAWLERPANDLSIEQIPHDRQIQPTFFFGPQIGNVRRPDLVRRGRRKISASRFAATGRSCFESVVAL